MKTKLFYLGIFLTALLTGSILAKPCTNKPPQPVSIQIKETLSPKQLVVSQEAFPEEEVLEEGDFWGAEDDPKFIIRLMETGEGYHGDQIEAKDGETWLSLSIAGNRSFLESVKVHIERVYDPIVDGENERLKTGRSVSVSGSGRGRNSVFLLKNSKLKEGVVKTLYLRPNSGEATTEEQEKLFQLENGFSRTFEMEGETYTLSVKKGKNKANESVAALVLENGKYRQTIYSYKSVADGHNFGSLGWVGDLDKDGKPDFYFAPFEHENISLRELFLSSQARPGKLIKKVALFSTSGC